MTKYRKLMEKLYEPYKNSEYFDCMDFDTFRQLRGMWLYEKTSFHKLGEKDANN